MSEMQNKIDVQKINIRVLCVEDEREIRENIAEILRMESFEVFEACNGKEGFEMFKQVNPDIIISDIMMPEADGYELLKNVRGFSGRNNNVPFIFLSALGQKKDIIKGVSLFANDYLLKPVDFEIMIAKVREKAINSLRIQELQQQEIGNIKDQVAVLLPKDFASKINDSINIVEKLCSEPYGPLPHRFYLEDFSMLNHKLKSLNATLVSSLDASVIDKKLNASEQVLTCSNFLLAIANKITQFFDCEILVNQDSVKYLPSLRIDFESCCDIFLTVISLILQSVNSDKLKFLVNLSAVLDYQNQLAIICYFRFYQQNKNEDFIVKVDLETIFAESNIINMLAQLGLQSAIGKTSAQNSMQSFVIAIPSYRLAN